MGVRWRAPRGRRRGCGSPGAGAGLSHATSGSRSPSPSREGRPPSPLAAGRCATALAIGGPRLLAAAAGVAAALSPPTGIYSPVGDDLDAREVIPGAQEQLDAEAKGCMALHEEQDIEHTVRRRPRTPSLSAMPPKKDPGAGRSLREAICAAVAAGHRDGQRRPRQPLPPRRRRVKRPPVLRLCRRHRQLGESCSVAALIHTMSRSVCEVRLPHP